MAEIERATPQTKASFVKFLVAAVVLGAILLAAMSSVGPLLHGWVAPDGKPDPSRVQIVMAAGEILLAAPAIGMAIYLWRLASLVARSRRFPPPGTSVVRDTPVLEGNEALTRAKLLKALAGVILVTATVMGVILWRLAMLITRANGAT
jgi:hypothetical protein